jgi:pimeloyl-ACP methyl ester carboxylesterase
MIRNKSFNSFDGSEIHYSIIGNGKKKVFLVHGLLTDRLTWVPFALLLRNKYTFITLEVRGHGLSENNNVTSYTGHEDCARDLSILASNILDWKNGEKAIVAAISMGNAIAWTMKQKFGDEWVEKYIVVDHSIRIQVPGFPESNVFTSNSEEFWDCANYIAEEIRKNPEYYKRKSLSDTNKEIIKRAKRAHHLVAVESVVKGGRFDLVTKFPSWIVDNAFMVATRLYSTWRSQFIIGSSYRVKSDFQDIVSSITKPMIFFVGKKNRVFDCDWQLKCINEIKPESKVYKFEHSGHELMQAEPIKFLKCFKEALDS